MEDVMRKFMGDIVVLQDLPPSSKKAAEKAAKIGHREWNASATNDEEKTER